MIIPRILSNIKNLSSSFFKELRDSLRGILFPLFGVAILLLISIFLTSIASGAISNSDIKMYYPGNTTLGMYKDAKNFLNLTNTNSNNASSCRVGSCFYFDNVNDYVSTAATTYPGGATGLSICGWVKAVSTTSAVGSLYQHGSHNNAVSFSPFSSNNWYLFADSGAGLGYGYVSSATYTPSPYYFTHYCYVYNGSGATDAARLKFYVNGTAKSILFAGTLKTGALPSVSNKTYFGSKYSDAAAGFTGWMDEIYVIDKTITPTEVDYLWSLGKNGSQYPLSSALNFKITAVQYANGSTINSFNATIKGNTWSTTNGTLTTSIMDSNTSMMNITVRSAGYFNNYTWNKNPSSNYAAKFIKNKVVILALDKDNSSVITAPLINLSGTVISSTIYPGSGSYNLKLSKYRYATNSTTQTFNSLENKTLTILMDRYRFSIVSPTTTTDNGSTSYYNINESVNGLCSFNQESNDKGVILYYSWVDENNSRFINGSAYPHSLSNSYLHTCMIRSNDSKGLCWGLNSQGQLGDSSTSARQTPTLVSGVHKFLVIDAGLGYGDGVKGAHTLAINNNSRLLSWGDNDNGQLGDGTLTERHSPVFVNTTLQFIDVKGGYNNSGALTINGTLYFWGYNHKGNFGLPATQNVLNPRLFVTDKRFSSFSLGYHHVLAIEKNSSFLYAWGNNTNGLGLTTGHMGIGNTSYSASPVRVNTTEKFIKVSAGYHISCGLTTTGRIMSWGYNADGRIVDGTSGPTRYVPVYSSFPTGRYVDVSCSDTQVCGVMSNGTLYCGGWNWKGEVGDGTTTPRTTAVSVSDSSTYRMVDAGHTSACASRSNDSKIKCWGRNEYGGLGVGDNTERHVPTLILSSATPLFYHSNLSYYLSSLPYSYNLYGSSYSFECSGSDDSSLRSSVYSSSFEFNPETIYSPPVEEGYWFILSNVASWNVSITNLTTNVSLSSSSTVLNTTLYRNNGSVNISARASGYGVVLINNTVPWNNLSIVFTSLSVPPAPSLNGSVVVNVNIGLKNETILIVTIGSWIVAQAAGPITSLVFYSVGVMGAFALPNDYLGPSITYALRIFSILLFLAFSIEFWFPGAIERMKRGKGDKQ